MNLNETPAAALDPNKHQAWYRGLTSYHWFVLVVCWLAWMFDTFDQQLFVLCRKTALTDLLHNPGNDIVTSHSGFITMIMMFGWATGGIIFGILGD